MAGKRKANEAGSTNDLRGRVLGVLKVATADQIQRLSSPHVTYRHTPKKTASQRKEARTASHRGAANDLCRHGLVLNGGRTRDGEEVRILTAAGLATAAAIELEPRPGGDGRHAQGRGPLGCLSRDDGERDGHRVDPTEARPARTSDQRTAPGTASTMRSAVRYTSGPDAVPSLRPP
ncbi:hypothetical protein ACWIHQ_19300 [Streptomyces anulatus]